MKYSTQAIISKVKSGVAGGGVTVTFKAENRPEDNPVFVRKFERGGQKLDLIEKYMGGPIEMPGNQKKIPVDRDGGWKINYGKIEAELSS